MNKTMKSLLVSLFLLGLSASVHAGGKLGNGWTATTVLVSSGQIATGSTFLKKVVLSTGGISDWLVLYNTAAINGLTLAVAQQQLSSVTVIPALVYGSTTTQANSGVPVNNTWSAGEGPDDFVYLKDGLYYLKTGASSGEALKATVYWSK